MIKHVFSIVMAATLLSVNGGCSGMQNFLFGRGARCGLCNSNPGGLTGPQFGNTMHAPCGQSPAHPGPCAQGPFQGGFAGPFRGAPTAGGGHACGSCGSHMGGDCGCGADPYMSSGVVGLPPSGQVVAPIQGDDFRARRFDSDGSQIYWEEPSYGGTSL